MFQYDVSYFYHMLRIYSKSAEDICRVRWDFVKETNPKIVLDYGSGCGFFKAFAPCNIMVDTYDIMPIPITGITREKYDLITFWDVLEHIDWDNEPDKKIESIFYLTNFIAATIPILPIGKDFKTWKHNKDGEHIFRFQNLDSVIHFFKQREYKLVKIQEIECPPREDVYSFLFKNMRQCV